MKVLFRNRSQEASRAQRAQGFWLKQQAQSLIEVALFVPVFTLLVCYAVDLGYFYLVAASLSSSARNAVEYSVQGNAATASSKLPAGGPVSTATSVAALAVADLTSFLNASASTSVYVCSNSIVSSSHPSRCASYGATTLSYTADSDPESSLFQLNRVDVVYTISPPIPLGFAGTSLNIIPTSFHRTVEMRAIN
jgi:Flp pilus assembly protein TadG